MKRQYKLIESNYSTSEDGLEGVHYFEDTNDSNHEVRVYTTDIVVTDCIEVALDTSEYKEFKPFQYMLADAINATYLGKIMA